MTDLTPTIEHLGTPLAWTDPAGTVLGCNGAFARWLGVSARRLIGLSLDDLDAEPPRLSDLLARLPLGADAPLHARRARLRAFASGERFADLWLARLDDSVLIEVHPADEFPLEDYANTLPGALHAALK